VSEADCDIRALTPRGRAAKRTAMKTWSSLLATLALAVAAAACGGPSTTAETPAKEEGKASPEAIAAMTKTYETNLAQCEAGTKQAEAKLVEFLDKVQGKANDAMGKPLPPISEVAAGLAKEKVIVTLENKGTPETPLFMVKDSFMEEGQKLAGAPPAKMQAFAKRAQVVQPLTTALRDQVNASNAALTTALTQSLPQCLSYSKAFTNTLAAMKNGGEEPTPEVFALYGKYLEANVRSQTVMSTTLATMAVLRAAVKGKDAKALDAIVDGARKTLAEPVKVTPEQAKQTYEVAAAELTGGCEKALADYAAKHPEAKIDPKSSCSGEGLKPKGAPKGDKAEEGGGLFDTILALVPGGQAIKAAAVGAKAIADGDAAGALRSAASMVPPGTPLATALSTAMPLVGI
jgi:hypothetical protein